MNTSEGRPNKSTADGTIEGIRDYDNIALRAIFENADLAKPGDTITPDDYEATKSRAAVLAKSIKNQASPETLLLTAFVDRMRLVSKIGEETIKKIPDEALRSILYVDTGETVTDEELTMLRGSHLGLKEWEKERAIVKDTTKRGFDVAINKEDNVIARGSTPQEAVHRAQGENGRQL